MPLTKQEYDDLIARSKAGEICFMFDPTQCKNLLLKLSNAEAWSRIDNSLRFGSRVVRAIVYFLEPVSFIVAAAAGFLWVHWWGLLIAPGLLVFLSLLKSRSSCGKQRIVGPLITFAIGILFAFAFRDQGVGFVIFTLAVSLLYLAEKMLYALPVLFFSILTLSNYDLVNAVYEKPLDNFNLKMGIPLMWHVETPEGRIPKAGP